MNYKAKGYKGMSLDKYNFSMLRELHMFNRGFVFDNLLDANRFEVWVDYSLFFEVARLGMITENDLAQDFAFIAEHCYVNSGNVMVSSAIVEVLMDLFLPPFRILNKYNKDEFSAKVSRNIGKLCDVNA
jgi:hypothetical protein